jgi:excisionase family DNA binding protein
VRPVSVTVVQLAGLEPLRRSVMTDAKGSTSDEVGELWDAKDAARYLKVSRSWVYQRAEAGLLPYLRVGGLLRFDPAVVRSFARGEGQPERILTFPGASPGKNG